MYVLENLLAQVRKAQLRYGAHLGLGPIKGFPWASKSDSSCQTAGDQDEHRILADGRAIQAA